MAWWLGGVPASKYSPYSSISHQHPLQILALSNCLDIVTCVGMAINHFFRVPDPRPIRTGLESHLSRSSIDTPIISLRTPLLNTPQK